MADVKRQWDVLSDERRKAFIDEIITFFKSEREEEIGIIAAQEILDFFLRNAASDIYNRGVEDAKEALQKRFGDLEVDLEMLRKSRQ